MHPKSIFRAAALAAALFAGISLLFATLVPAQETSNTQSTQQTGQSTPPTITAQPNPDGTVALHFDGSTHNNSPDASTRSQTLTTATGSSLLPSDSSNESVRLTELREKAELGSTHAQYTLAKEYLNNHDYAHAAEWFRKAAEKGVGTAQGELGELYQAGKGVPLDYAEAYFWLLLAPRYMGDALVHFDSTGAETHLTPDQKSAVRLRVNTWEKLHPLPAPPRMPQPIQPPTRH